MYYLLLVLIFRFFKNLTFLVIGSYTVFISILGLLSRVIVAQHMCWFLKASNPPMFDSINHFNFIPLGQMVSLFLPHIVHHTRLFNLTSYYCLPMFFYPLIFVGDLSRLCIFHNCKGWSKHCSWPCWIPLVAWPGRDISGKLNHLWILSWCHMDYISFGSFQLVLWHKVDILLWVFGYCPRSRFLGADVMRSG